MTHQGPGRIFLRGTTWWIAFYVGGREQRESVVKLTGKAPSALTEVDAEQVLRRRLKEVARGHFVPLKQARLCVADLLEDYETHLAVKDARGRRSLESHGQHVRKTLGPLQVVRLTGTDVERFVLAQRERGAAPASIRARIAVLRAALELGRRDGRVSVVPPMPQVRVANARQGFFEPNQMTAVIAQLPDPVDDVARFGYLTGWRVGEILDLTWANVDRAAGLIRLPDSKSGARVLPLVGELAALLEARWAKRVLGSAWVFHRRGRQVKYIRGAWRKACVAAGVPGKLFHDLRRTVARDLIAAGHDYKSAMTVTGHKTMSTFLRYQITSTRETAAALEGLQAHRRGERKRGRGTDTRSTLGHEGQA